MARDTNIRVFQDTAHMYRTHPVLVSACEASTAAQKMIAEGDAFPVAQPSRQQRAQVVVSMKRSFEAASGYPGKRVCVLNFASASNPGGGVVRGANAQEESLCRCSTLYPTLACDEMWERFYLPHCAKGDPLHNDDCIYTPDVVVFKTDTSAPELLPETDWYRVNVITCAAPNLRFAPSNVMNPGDGSMPALISDEALAELHRKRMRRILDIAAANGNDVVILGAFGCGAFCNDPQVVSRALNDVVQEYRHMFDVIEFAVYARSEWDVNFRTFRDALES